MKLFIASSITLFAFLATGSLGALLSKNDLEKFCSTVSTFVANGTKPEEIATAIKQQFQTTGLLQRIPGENADIAGKVGDKEGAKGYYNDYYPGNNYYPQSSYYPQSNYYPSDNYYPQYNNYYQDSYYPQSNYYPQSSYYPQSNYYPQYSDSYYPQSNYYGGKPNGYDSYYYPSKDDYYNNYGSYGNYGGGYGGYGSYGGYGGYGPYKAKPEGDDKNVQAGVVAKQGAQEAQQGAQQGPQQGAPQGHPQAAPQGAPQGSPQGVPQGQPRLVRRQLRKPGPVPGARFVHGARFLNAGPPPNFVNQLVAAFTGTAKDGKFDCTKFTFPESVDSNDEKAFGELQASIKSAQ